MVRSALFLALLLLPVPRAMAQVSQPGRGTVTGHVDCSDTHTPCRFASVTLEAVPDPSAHEQAASPVTYAGATDIAGNYRILNVDPGTYFVVGREAGYLSPTDILHGLSTNKALDPGSKSGLARAGFETVTLAANATATRNLSLTRGAVLSGTVRFDDGGLGINLRVSIFRQNDEGAWKPFSVHGGSGVISLLGIQNTDEFGRFALSGLPAGTYTVQVQLPGAVGVVTGIFSQGTTNIDDRQGEALAVFYGNKFRLSEASPVKLTEGELHPGVDVTIPTVGLHTVSGTLSRLANDAGPLNLYVLLLDPQDDTELRRTTASNDGSFTFANIPGGTYKLRVVPVGGGPSGTAGSLQSKNITVNVETDVTGLNVALQPARPAPHRQPSTN